MSKRANAVMELPKIDTKKDIQTVSVEIHEVAIKIPALVGLGENYATPILHARLNARESKALRVLVEGFDNKIFASPGSRSANGQDLIRYILNSVADQLGL